MLVLFAPGAPREKYFEELAEIAGVGLELARPGAAALPLAIDEGPEGHLEGASLEPPHLLPPAGLRVVAGRRQDAVRAHAQGCEGRRVDVDARDVERDRVGRGQDRPEVA